ncbi:3444_t:CDS:2 [Entrophospora sp. SA101]|nr:6532_t:CDS:2 [Entrophospora sp. SA101]CAJ0835404.1 6173_t:CDS:2 [Entrophospora sp. SA101]CAJ0842114.1 3444_t:CDS:2 [Entrophospora sp. SA101]
MAKMHTLQDTKSMESKKIRGQGYRLGSIRKQELKDALHVSRKCSITTQADVYIQRFCSRALQLISELHDIQNALSEKPKEAKSLQTKVKKLGGNLTSAQKNSSMKESEVLFLKSKLAELEQMKDELSQNHPVTAFSNYTSSVSQSDAPTSNKPKLDFSKFLKHRNNMDQTERIDAHQSSDTINKANDDTKPQNTNSSELSNMKSSTSEDSHADNSQIVETKIFSEEAISKTDFIGNDQSYATKIEMAEILPIGALGACETLVNDKYRIPPIVKLVILIIIAILIIWFVHKLIIWNKEKSTKSKSKNDSDRSKISDTIAIIVQKLPLVGLSIALCINHTWNKEVKLELHMRHEKFKNQYWRTVSNRWLYPWSKYEIEETINPIDYELNILFDETEIWSSL